MEIHTVPGRYRSQSRFNRPRPRGKNCNNFVNSNLLVVLTGQNNQNSQVANTGISVLESTNQSRTSYSINNSKKLRASQRKKNKAFYNMRIKEQTKNRNLLPVTRNLLTVKQNVKLENNRYEESTTYVSIGQSGKRKPQQESEKTSIELKEISPDKVSERGKTSMEKADSSKKCRKGKTVNSAKYDEFDDVSDSPLEDEWENVSDAPLEDTCIVEELKDMEAAVSNTETIKIEFPIGFRPSKPKYLKRYKSSCTYKPKYYFIPSNRRVITCVSEVEVVSYSDDAKTVASPSDVEAGEKEDEVSNEKEIEEVSNEKEIEEVSSEKEIEEVSSKKESKDEGKDKSKVNPVKDKDIVKKYYDFSQDFLCIQENIDEYKLPLLGLEYIAEVWSGQDPEISSVESYNCLLCNSVLEQDEVIDHLVTVSHRQSYLVKHFPIHSSEFKDIPAEEIVDTKKEEFDNMCKHVHNVCGRLLSHVTTRDFLKDKPNEVQRALDSICYPNDDLLKNKGGYIPNSDRERNSTNRKLESAIIVSSIIEGMLSSIFSASSSGSCSDNQNRENDSRGHRTSTTDDATVSKYSRRYVNGRTHHSRTTLETSDNMQKGSEHKVKICSHGRVHVGKTGTPSTSSSRGKDAESSKEDKENKESGRSSRCSHSDRKRNSREETKYAQVGSFYGGVIRLHSCTFNRTS